MAAPTGFTWTRRKNGDVIIEREGRLASTLRGAKADAFVADVALGDDQELMARCTGNYKRGNERTAGKHPRNR